MDAVSYCETTAQIRAFPDSGVAVAPTQFSYYQPPVPETHPIPDHVRKQAMDSFSCLSVRAEIRLANDNGEIMRPNLPPHHPNAIAAKISRMQIAGRDVDAIQRDITKDGFGREYG